MRAGTLPGVDDDFEPYEAPPTVYFGERWDAPLLDGNVVEVPVPFGRACLYCEEPIAIGDRGLMRVAVRGTADKPTASQEPVHMECELRAVIGDVAHLEGRCSCRGATPGEEPAGTCRGRDASAVDPEHAEGPAVGGAFSRTTSSTKSPDQT